MKEDQWFMPGLKNTFFIQSK